MSAAAHTPGPWKADTNAGCKRISAKPYEQHRQTKRMEVACTPGIYPEEEDRANARLIAAAPELLAACQRALPRLPMPMDDRDMSEAAGIYRDLTAAIAKSEGRS